MKNTITRIIYAGIILFVALCFHLQGCQKKSFQGDKAGAAEGFVKDSLSLIPIVGADVFLDDEPYLPYPKTDSTGYYKVVLLLGGPRTTKITIKAQGYKTKDKNIILRPSQTLRVDFFLVKEGG